jgi:predicted Zn-dependent peptidase
MRARFAEAMENARRRNMNAGYRLRAHVVLRANVVAEHAPFALDLIADILFAPHWAPDDLGEERRASSRKSAAKRSTRRTIACLSCTKRCSIQDQAARAADPG